jgi:formamidopyrimidine-DNA glycosylase
LFIVVVLVLPLVKSLIGIAETMLLNDLIHHGGIGNKYKSEILFLQKLCPFRFANNLSPSEEQEVLQEIPSIENGLYKCRTYET